MHLQKNAQNRTLNASVSETTEDISLKFCMLSYGDHFLKISSNSEVVTLDPFAELTQNDPVTYVQKSAGKKWAAFHGHSRSSDRSGTCDFLLVIHSNHGQSQYASKKKDVA